MHVSYMILYLHAQLAFQKIITDVGMPPSLVCFLGSYPIIISQFLPERTYCELTHVYCAVFTILTKDRIIGLSYNLFVVCGQQCVSNSAKTLTTIW